MLKISRSIIKIDKNTVNKIEFLKYVKFFSLKRKIKIFIIKKIENMLAGTCLLKNAIVKKILTGINKNLIFFYKKS